MAIIERSKGKYTIEIHLGKDSNGKQKRYTETFHCSKKSEAVAREAELKAQYKKGDLTQIKKISFSEFIDLWMKEYAKPKLEDKTFYEYKGLLDRRVIPSLGFIRLDKLTPMDILMFENDLRKEGSRIDGKKGNLSEKTIRHYHFIINEILESAVKWGYIVNNPAQKIDKPKVTKKDIEYLNLEQTQRFIQYLQCESIKHQAFIMLAIDTGCRRGELVALTWNDVDFDRNIINIDKAVSSVPKNHSIKAPKTKSSVRKICVSANTMAILKTLKTKQISDKLRLGNKWQGTNDINNNRVFIKWNGEELKPNSVSDFVPDLIERYNQKINEDKTINKELKEQLFLPQITLHGLRHTNATILISKNINLKTVSSRLGHSNISTTMDIYTKALKSADEEVANIMGEILIPSSKENNEKLG